MNRLVSKGFGWRGPLSESATHIRQALDSLIECPETFRPFVVIACGDIFVQFCGSMDRGICFDVPALGIVADYGTAIHDVDAGVALALDGLRRQGLGDDARLHVTFESTHDAPGQKVGKA